MSAAVVSTSVIGSAATMIQRGGGSARRARGPGRGRCGRWRRTAARRTGRSRSPGSRARRPGSRRRRGSRARPVDLGRARPGRATTPGGTRCRIDSATATAMPGQHAEQRDAEERRHRRARTRSAAAASSRDRARRCRRARATRRSRRRRASAAAGSAAARARASSISDDRAGADQAGELGLAPRPARPPRSASRWCSPGSPGTARRRCWRRRSRSSPGCRRPPAPVRAANADAVEIVSVSDDQRDAERAERRAGARSDERDVRDR